MKPPNRLFNLFVIGGAILAAVIVLLVVADAYFATSNADLSVTAVPTLAPSAGPSSSATATSRATLTPSPAPTSTPTPAPPTATATALPSAVPTLTPTATPVATLTAAPTATSMPTPMLAPAPVVSLLYPTAGLTVAAGQQIIIQATAAGAAGLAHTDIWVDGAVYVSIPNALPGGTSMTVAQPWTSSVPGTHTFTALAYDNLGRVSTSTTISIQVINPAPPSAWIAQPYTPNGQIVFEAGQLIQLSYWGSAADGVSRLELWVDGQLAASNTNSGQSTTMNVQQTWSSTTIGEHTLFVRVYDMLNQTTDSAPLVIGLTDTNPPSVTLVSPANGAQLAAGSTIPVVVSASDSKGITSIQLWIDSALYSTWNSSTAIGQTPVNTSFAWAAPALGSHVLHLVASDSVGLSTTTSGVVVSVLPPLPTPTGTPTASPTVTQPKPTPTGTRTASPTVTQPKPTPTGTRTASPAVTQPQPTPTGTRTP